MSPKRSWSVLATSEFVGLLLELDAVELGPADHALLLGDRKRLPGGRIVDPLLQEQHGAAGPWRPLWERGTSPGASISVGFSLAVDEAGQVAVVLVGPARRLLLNRGEPCERGDRRARRVEDHVVRAPGQPQHRVVLRRRHREAVGAGQICVEPFELGRCVVRDHRLPQLGPEPGHEVHADHRRSRLAQRGNDRNKLPASCPFTMANSRQRVRGVPSAKIPPCGLLMASDHRTRNARVESGCSPRRPSRALLVGSFEANGRRDGRRLVRLGREALAAAEWERARSFFEQAAGLGESAEILADLGEALQVAGEHGRAIELKERAFADYERRGLRAEAAELARWLAFLYMSVHGNVAAANGWTARAESVLVGVEECAAHGWLTLDRAPWTSDASEREELATAAIAIARRYGDRDLEFDAMALLGEAYVASGRVTEGMTLLDQAMVAVASGEVVGVGPAGEIYCRLLSACERATDVRRAEQWLDAATRFAAWGDFVPPTCRMHYGGILIALGRWDEAERELLAAIRIFEAGYWASQLFALLRLADLRVRQGRFEEAERLLEGIDWHASAKRSLARIALARGDLALAGDLVRLCLESTPSSDPDGTPVLAVLVEVQLESGDLTGAEETVDQLAVLAVDREDDRTRAVAKLVGGTVRAARGDQ